MVGQVGGSRIYVPGEGLDRATANQVLGELGEALDQWGYTGDAESVLLHHMRESALDPTIHGSTLDNYFRLAEEIDEHSAEGATPVLVGFAEGPTEGDEVVTDTALVVVEPGKPHFRSAVYHEGSLGSAEDPYSETQRALYLTGKTRITRADITGRDEDSFEPTAYIWGTRADDDDWGLTRYGKELTLRYVEHVDTGNSGTPASDGEAKVNRLESPVFVVGWQNVTDALHAAVEQAKEGHGRADTLKFVRQLMKFLNDAGELGSLRERSAPLDKIFRGAQSFEDAYEAL